MIRADDLLEKALELAKEHFADKNDVIDKRIHSDIASFGTAIQQCGLLPAVAMFSNSGPDAGIRHLKMINVIHALMGNPIAADLKKPLMLETIADKDNATLNALPRYAMEACIALKLAVRTVKLEEVNDEQS